MDNIVDTLNRAYEKFVLASASVLESKEGAGGQKGSLTDAALENFKEKWELFRVACDQAEEFVESVKQRIGSECSGLLKKSKDLILEVIPGSVLLENIGEKDFSPDGKCIALEFISSSDNKEAVVKAANILLHKYLISSHPENDKANNFFTESNLNEALRVFGENVHVPDLLLVYGPLRSHFGFPAWRLRYTEIVHMGSLK